MNSIDHTVTLWSEGGRGWKNIFAQNPVDIISGDVGCHISDIQSFFGRNKGRLIIGFLSHEFGLHQYGILPNQSTLVDLPALCFLAFDTYEPSSFSKHTTISEKSGYPFIPLVKKSTYLRSIHQIQEYIRSGDIYQANFTHFLRNEKKTDTTSLIKALKAENPVDFGAIWQTPDYHIYSFSPERFATIRGKSIITEPIKGTRPRSIGMVEDQHQREALFHSEKEKAELFMITDLLRNDLSKVCKVGSVLVKKSREILPLQHVWHTHSIISGELQPDVAPIDAILSMIPGGSVTGCPKKRALEIINQLETYQRSVYTGIIGVQYPDGDSDWSIAIRTVVAQNQQLYLGVGGGITLDSSPEEEYAESLAKAKSFMEI